LLAWFDAHERPLPWRSTTPWGVLVSEFMLQQTPVQRVLPVWGPWLERWPTPASLAADSVADALRAWGRLGYPRRAGRLHASAVMITERFGGAVPSSTDELLALPGVGEYTAAAVRAFAFGQHSVVMDTNVRRVLARALDGSPAPAPHITAGERGRAAALWPSEPGQSSRWSGAVMEFGALVCTARRPSCDACPITGECSWTRLGQPASTAPLRRQAEYVGSDRQARGHLLAVLRDTSASVDRAGLTASWTDDLQAERALRSLLEDGLVVALPRGRVALPEG
jgi:A/G-specific adenine glycosylase